MKEGFGAFDGVVGTQTNYNADRFLTQKYSILSIVRILYKRVCITSPFFVGRARPCLLWVT